jgi:hypothetical protein
MTDVPDTPPDGYWLASDGNWYPPDSAIQQRPPAEKKSGIWRRFRRLPTGAQIASWVVLAFVLLAAIGAAAPKKTTNVSTHTTTSLAHTTTAVARATTTAVPATQPATTAAATTTQPATTPPPTTLAPTTLPVVTLPPTTQPVVTQPVVTAPATTVPGNGATALCRDGTLSYSATHSGTCSHHGGVAVWYK